MVDFKKVRSEQLVDFIRSAGRALPEGSPVRLAVVFDKGFSNFKQLASFLAILPASGELLLVSRDSRGVESFKDEKAKRFIGVFPVFAEEDARGIIFHALVKCMPPLGTPPGGYPDFVKRLNFSGRNTIPMRRHVTTHTTT